MSVGSIRIVVVSLVFAGFFVQSSSVVAAQPQPVYSLKNLGEHNGANGDAYTRVEVKCNTRDEKRYIHRQLGAENWCVNGDSAECDNERIDAATRACLMDQPPTALAITSAPTQAEPSPEELKAAAERRRLESELLANEQRKLELRDRQLKLRQREFELRKKGAGNLIEN